MGALQSYGGSGANGSAINSSTNGADGRAAAAAGGDAPGLMPIVTSLLPSLLAPPLVAALLATAARSGSTLIGLAAGTFLMLSGISMCYMPACIFHLRRLLAAGLTLIGLAAGKFFFLLSRRRHLLRLCDNGGKALHGLFSHLSHALQLVSTCRLSNGVALSTCTCA